MKIAIPLAEGKLTTHFGHCKTFAFISVDQENKCITQILEVEPPPHEPGVLPVWLHEHNISHVIAGGLGPKAKTLMEERNMVVMAGAPSLAPKLLVNQFLAGELELGKNGCTH